MAASDQLVFFVNGKKIVEKDPDPEVTLLQYLRSKLRCTGTKSGCGEGGCGACTVMVSKYDKQLDKIFHFSANACLVPVCSLHGQAVTTVEGIGSTRTRLHPVQKHLAEAHGSQCGFCTPGMVMSMYTLLRNNPQPTFKQMESFLDGNLCRCTGYRPIIDGFRPFTKEYCPLGKDCCRNQSGSSGKGRGSQKEDSQRTEVNGTAGYDPSQEPIFPPDLKIHADNYNQQSLRFQTDRVKWFRPVSLDELLKLNDEYPDARLVVGNTEVGIETRFKNIVYPVLISATHVQELCGTTRVDDGFTFGASVTLTEISNVLENAISELPEHKTRVFVAIVEMLKWFGGQQIRNVATVGGNIMTASPISDLNPLFLAAGAVMEVTSKGGQRKTIKMDSNFFKGYRQTAVLQREILLSVTIPFSKKNEYFYGYKQANRKEDDTSIVNAGMRVLFQDRSNIIKDMSLAFGGMAATTVMAKKTTDAFVGSRWDDDLVSKACNLLAEDLPLYPGAPGGMVEFRRALASSFFFKFYLTVQMKMLESGVTKTKVPSSCKSATEMYHRPHSKGWQVFEEVTGRQSPDDGVWRLVAHASAHQQTTGEAMYVDDIPRIDGELFLAFVISTKAHAKIKVDASDALAMPGVVDFITHKDIPGINAWGILVPDEEVMASERVVCQGQVIGGILAENRTQAQQATKKVKVQYEEMEATITIESAIKKESYYGNPQVASKGDLNTGFSKSDHILEGESRTGAQEHFYLETQAVLAVPKNEDKTMEIHCNSHHLTMVQDCVCRALGVPAHKIVLKVKRVGGAFGGKQTRNGIVTIPAAVAAAKHGRPVRCILDRDDDMMMTGTRNPSLGKYKVGFNKDGKIQAYEVNLYLNGGMSMDYSTLVARKAVDHSDNCYKIPNIQVLGYACKTNIPSNTAFRGFGGPQGMLVVENAITRVAEFLGKSPEEVRQINMYQEGDETHFGQNLVDCNIGRCWKECMEQSKFDKRRKQVDIFNGENRWKKQGISVVPVKYGLSYTARSKWLNQGAALVHVYLDGSVLVTHGGVEIGQGIHTKMIQIASHVLQIPASKIFIDETSTDKIPNTTPSAASTSSDLYGGAVQDACEKIYSRLEPFIQKNPEGCWEDWVKAAYFARVQLSTTGYYTSPGLDYNNETASGNLYNYFVWGAGCSEVEVDCLTRDHQVLRTDIVIDVGQSLNPAIDIGQIEGAFTHGYGMMCLEQYMVSPEGTLRTRGPSNYKIPGFRNIPVQFNVFLLKGSINKKAVYSSKGVGEPPLFLASSVLFAIKDAIMSAREDAGYQRFFNLDCPATPARIRMSCEDRFTEQFPIPPKGSFTPWFVDL